MIVDLIGNNSSLDKFPDNLLFHILTSNEFTHETVRFSLFGFRLNYSAFGRSFFELEKLPDGAMVRYS